MTDQTIQIVIFFGITALIAVLTYITCSKANKRNVDDNKEYFLAGGGLKWFYIAGSITLTNLSTDQLVGMNGNQMALLAWWEIAGFFGLLILAKVFLPIYYKNNCTTTTELLQRRYNDPHIRAVIAGLFLLGNLFIFLPAVLYSGSLFMKTMFNVDLSIMTLSLLFTIAGASYAIFGGLRAVAVSDTYSGVGLLALGILVVILSLNAINFDFSGIPAERLTLIGDDNSPIPWHTLLTGMVFIQMFYWSTNQTITQRAMAAPNIKEAQKGVFAAAAIRILIVPPMIVIPGIVSYKLFGDIGDQAYGRIVAEVLPSWLSGAFAAMMAAAVLTTFNSILNSSAALYVCDIHEQYFQKEKQMKVHVVSNIASIAFCFLALALVPAYASADSIINLIQELYGMLSMPILSVFIVGLLFSNVDPKAAITAVVSGTGIYAFFIFVWAPFHYIHMMAITLMLCVLIALTVNRLVFQKQARCVLFKQPDGKSEQPAFSVDAE
jgi:SSS family solute:Na+ symporter